jgi:hypothetical protein
MLETHVSPVIGHGMLQPPQFSGSLVVSTHPAEQQVVAPVQAGPPLQLPGDVQVLATHVSPGGQATLQPLQLLGSLVVSVQPDGQHVSDPVHGAPPLHDSGGWHCEPEQVSPGGHGMLQPPQFSGSLVVSLQPDAQHCCVPVHAGPPLHAVAGWHIEPTQGLPGGHGWLQPPQFCGSLVVSVQPVPQHCWLPVQTWPWQTTSTHELMTHSTPGEQGWLQPPQFCGSLVVSVQPSLQHCWLPVHT